MSNLGDVKVAQVQVHTMVIRQPGHQEVNISVTGYQGTTSRTIGNQEIRASGCGYQSIRESGDE